MELVELYLHSREIQRKIDVAKRPKPRKFNNGEPIQFIQPQGMRYFTERPENPVNGDLYLDLASGRSSFQVFVDNEWATLSAAEEARSVPVGYPYDRASFEDISASPMQVYMGGTPIGEIQSVQLSASVIHDHSINTEMIQSINRPLRMVSGTINNMQVNWPEMARLFGGL